LNNGFSGYYLFLKFCFLIVIPDSKGYPFTEQEYTKLYGCCLYFLSLCPFASINWPMSAFINDMIIRFPPISCHTYAWILANIWTFWFWVHLHTCVLMCLSLEQLAFVLLLFQNCGNLLVSWGVRSNLCTLSDSFANYILTKP